MPLTKKAANISEPKNKRAKIEKSKKLNKVEVENEAKENELKESEAMKMDTTPPASTIIHLRLFN